MVNSFQHIPVLLKDTLTGLNIKPGGRYLDGTLGGGGHSSAILNASSPDGTLVGIDRDPAAIKAAEGKLKAFENRFQIIHGQFSQIFSKMKDLFDGILLDLGVSSPQLDTAERGFSFDKDGPLDMRMDPNQKRSAADIVNRSTEKELADILYTNGDEPRSRRIARAIVKNRPWNNTVELAECIRVSSGYRNSRTHPATRSFQAIRIAVNDELTELRKALDSAFELLKPGGRLAVISFHSLEDRIVKRRFKEAAGIGTPRDAYGHPITPPLGRLISPKGLSGREHDPENPRARSARLRIFEKSDSSLPKNWSN